MYKLSQNLYLLIIKFLRIIFFYDVNKLKYYDHKSLRFHLFSLLSVYNVKEMIVLNYPWWTYNSVNFLSEYLNGKKNLYAFEYGPGASSFWLKQFCTNIKFVEHDESFFKFFKNIIKYEKKIDGKLVLPTKLKNKKFVSRKKGWENYSFENYVKSISQEGRKFDIIVIDGRCRDDAFEYSKNFLNKNGIIIFDNSKRKRYLSIFNSKMRFKRFYGTVPTLPFKDETTIFFND